MNKEVENLLFIGDQLAAAKEFLQARGYVDEAASCQDQINRILTEAVRINEEERRGEMV